MCLDLNHLHCKMQPVLVHIHFEDTFETHKVGKAGNGQSFKYSSLNHLHCKMQPVLVHIHLFTLIEDIFDKVGKSRTWAFKFQVSSFKFQVPQSESSSLPSAAFTVAFLLQLKYPRSANFNFFQTIYQLHFKHAMLAGTISKTNINSSIPCLKI